MVVPTIIEETEGGSSFYRNLRSDEIEMVGHIKHEGPHGSYIETIESIKELLKLIKETMGENHG